MFFNDGEVHETDWIILGTPFLQSLYSVFDVDNEMISCEHFTQLIFAILSGGALRSLANLFQCLFGRINVKGYEGYHNLDAVLLPYVRLANCVPQDGYFRVGELRITVKIQRY